MEGRQEVLSWLLASGVDTSLPCQAVIGRGVLHLIGSHGVCSDLEKILDSGGKITVKVGGG